MEDNLFTSKVSRLGPVFFPQIISVDGSKIYYCKYKLKNHLGVPPDILEIKTKEVTGVVLVSHFFSGTEVMISTRDGNYLHLRNFKREDAEKINNLILN